MAKVKERIMLSGGVFASMAMSVDALQQFASYKPSANSDGVVRIEEDLSSAGTATIMHAIFCYGWWDNSSDVKDGWWLCKNRCGW
jgi:hypothetical protein